MSSSPVATEQQTVFGYVRLNYVGNIPRAITRLCLHYFDQNHIINFKGNKLKDLWSLNNGRYCGYTMKFNQDLSFHFQIVPNANHEQVPNRFSLGVKIESMSDTIDYIIGLFELSCFDHNTLDRNIKFCAKLHHENKNKWRSQSIGSSPQFRHLQQLLFNFKVLHIQIKYKVSNKMLYYPSLQKLQLTESSELKWSVPGSLVDDFKNYPHKSAYTGPVDTNLCIICGPNGFVSADIGYFIHGVLLTVFPKDIIKMTVKVDMICELEDDKFEGNYEQDLHHDKLWLVAAPRFLKDKLKSKLSFVINLEIKALYDLDGNEVPRDEWIDHNVILSE